MPCVREIQLRRAWPVKAAGSAVLVFNRAALGRYSCAVRKESSAVRCEPVRNFCNQAVVPHPARPQQSQRHDAVWRFSITMCSASPQHVVTLTFGTCSTRICSFPWIRCAPEAPSDGQRFGRPSGWASGTEAQALTFREDCPWVA